MAEYPPVPRVPDLTQPAKVCVAWVIAAEHEETIDLLRGSTAWYWPAAGELTTGCICRDRPDWFPGQPDNPACPVHGHRPATHAAVVGGRSTDHCLACGLHWTDEHHTRSMAVPPPPPPAPPCSCRYRIHTTSVVTVATRIRPPRQRLVTGTGFDIDPGCEHHGDLRRVEYFDATYMDVLDENERKGD